MYGTSKRDWVGSNLVPKIRKSHASIYPPLTSVSTAEPTITDARVLQPEFIPREVQHRDAEVNYLSSVLAPITDGRRADPALLYGPSGVGKTGY